ncbi:MAG: hypothetical protein K6E92_01650 [Lachnospiraceae bacterium]|nr:hypothetical protein [Lachnospiraceae bacterium]
MPKKFLDPREISNMVSTSSYLDAEGQKWANEHLPETEAQLGYRTHVRSSARSALMIVLLGDPEQGFDTAEEMLAHMKDLERDPARMRESLEALHKRMMDPNKTPEQVAEEWGRMTATAFKKLLDYRLPAFDANDPDALAELESDVIALGTLMTDQSQDTQRIIGDSADVHLKEAFLKGFGGQQAYDSLYNAVANYGQGLRPAFELLGDQNYPVTGRAAARSLLTDFFEEHGGKRIGDVPQKYTGWGTAVRSQAITFIPEGANEAEYEAYLNGTSPNAPAGVQALKQEVEDQIGFQTESAQKRIEEQASKLAGTFFAPQTQWMSGLSDEECKNLLNLPLTKRQDLIVAYQDTFGMLYRNEEAVELTAKGLTEFDMIRAEGKSIRQIVEEKYPDVQDPARLREAMMLETMLAVSDGVAEFAYLEVGTGTRTTYLELHETPPVAHIQLTADPEPLTWMEADRFLKDPRSGSEVLDSAGSLTVNVQLKSYLAGSSEILRENGLGLLDCIYLGNTNLRNLYEQKYRDQVEFTSEQETERFMLRVLAAERMTHSVADNPLTAYLAIPVPGAAGYDRTIIPLSLEGDLYAKHPDDIAYERRVENRTYSSLEARLSRLPEEEKLAMLVKGRVADSMGLLNDGEREVFRNVTRSGGVNREDQVDREFMRLRSSSGGMEAAMRDVSTGDFLPSLRASEPRWRAQLSNHIEEWDRIRTAGRINIAQEEQSALRSRLRNLDPDQRAEELFKLEVLENHEYLKESEIAAKNEILAAYPEMQGKLDEFRTARASFTNDPNWEEKYAQELANHGFLAGIREPSFRSVGAEPIEQLRHMYEFALDTDKMDAHARLHFNSKEWKDFTKALRELYKLQRSLDRDDKALSPEDQRKAEKLMEKVVETAETYLADKDRKPRETDMGMARYGLAFAALRICQPTLAEAKLERYNGGFPRDKQVPLEEIDNLTLLRKDIVDKKLDLDAMVEDLQDHLGRTTNGNDFAKTAARIAYFGGLRIAVDRGLGSFDYATMVRSDAVDREATKIMNTEEFKNLMAKGAEKVLSLAKEKGGAGLVKAIGTPLSAKKQDPLAEALMRPSDASMSGMGMHK